MGIALTCAILCSQYKMVSVLLRLEQLCDNFQRKTTKGQTIVDKTLHRKKTKHWPTGIALKTEGEVRYSRMISRSFSTNETRNVTVKQQVHTLISQTRSPGDRCWHIKRHCDRCLPISLGKASEKIRYLWRQRIIFFFSQFVNKINIMSFSHEILQSQ